MEIPKGKLLVSYEDSDGHTESEILSVEKYREKLISALKGQIKIISVQFGQCEPTCISEK